MFKDRKEAGRLLVKKFSELILSHQDLVVIALPKGGVPVANEIAKALNLPLDILSVKKIGSPSNPELALGAVTEEGEYYLDNDIVENFNLKSHKLNKLIENAHEDAYLQARRLRGNRVPYVIKNKNVVLVDDGIVTGASIRTAIELLREHRVRSILLAVPICSKQILDELINLVDVPLVLKTPAKVHEVSTQYENFPEVSDDTVYEILNMRTPVLDSVANL